jgi:hypothetical protein
VEVPQLDMIELIALRRKTTAYIFNDETPLLLSDREMSWVLSEHYRIPISVVADGVMVTARKPYPLEGGGCGDVEFVGRVQVAHGVLRVWPKRVRFGGYPLPVFPDAMLVVDPGDFGADGPSAGRLIGAIESLEVRQGTFRLLLSDTKILP